MTDGSSDEMGDSLLQMLDPDESLALNYAEGEDFDMDLNMLKARMMPPHSCQTTTEEVEPLMLKLIMIRF